MKITVMSVSAALMIGVLGGYWLCHLEKEAETGRLNEMQAQQETERLKKAMENNRNLQQTVSELQAKMKKENDNAKRKYDVLLDRIRRGVTRVSIPVRTSGGLPAAGCTADAGRKARAELDPETVERILGVGREGDSAIRDLNQCIDQYKAVAEICGRTS